MRLTILPLMLILAAAGCAHSQVKANYDTSWTMVYDGGRQVNGTAINDHLIDVKVLSNGEIVSVGRTCDSLGIINKVQLFRRNSVAKSVFQKR